MARWAAANREPSDQEWSLVAVDEPRGPTVGPAPAGLRSQPAAWGSPSYRAARYSAAYDSNPNPSCTALGQIGGDLGAAVACADNQHVLAAIRPRIAVFRGMNHWTIERTWPSRQRGHPRIAASHHDHPCRTGTGCGLDGPVTVLAVDARSFDPEPWLETVVRRVQLEVSHELVACNPAAKLPGIR